MIAYRRLGQFNGSGSFAGWLLIIAYRCFLQQQRQQRRRMLIHEQIQHQDFNQIDSGQKRQAEQLDLERALAQIESTEAAAITLNLSMGYSHSEVSDILKIPLGTVKSHINRGLKKLKHLMLENEGQNKR